MRLHSKTSDKSLVALPRKQAAERVRAQNIDFQILESFISLVFAVPFYMHNFEDLLRIRGLSTIFVHHPYKIH